MITIDHMSFGYGGRPLFSDLGLELSRGAVYGLLGKNGAGKTTLLKLMSGLLFPRSGKIETMGYTPGRRQPEFLDQIFILPEEFDLPRMNMKQYGLAFGRFYSRFSHLQLTELMRELEVDEMQPLHSMSFGQKKKAYIAFAIACNTPLLLMDEPTNGLDIPSKSSFRRVISSIATEERTIVISTHQVRDLDQLIDSVVILDQNEILLNATTLQITDRLCFSKLTEDMHPIYAESSIYGMVGITENATGTDTPLDMELLFNAAITNRAAIKQIFNTKEA